MDKSANKALAYAFVKYAASEEGKDLRIKAGAFPSTTKDLQSPEFLGTEFPYFGGQKANEILGQSAPASDYYALGVMLFEALTGQRPYAGDALEVMRRKQIADALDTARRWSDARGYPLYLGEFGTTEKADTQSRATYARIVRD